MEHVYTGTPGSAPTAVTFLLEEHSTTGGVTTTTYYKDGDLPTDLEIQVYDSSDALINDIK